jgi:flagellar motor switch protein FliN/FliY
MAQDDEFDDLDDLTTDEDFNLDEDFDLDESTSDVTDQEEISEPQQEEQSPAPASVPQKAPQTGEAKRISSNDIHVALVVEVGQIRLTMDKLLALEPGNLLDLNVRPEDGVTLIVNGKTIGKGELVRMGESIGVRILQLGH